MDITDARAIKFVNEVVRPTAEKIRALKIELNSINAKWSSEILMLVSNDGSVIQDGREAEGISRLVGSDINDLMYGVNSIVSTINGLAPQTIEKPCVRPIQVI
jgi:hypothetical protein